jgi:hypothetical protein
MATEDVSEEQRADAERDVLALLACALAGDYDGACAVKNGASAEGIVVTLMGLLIERLEDAGLGPASWVAERQAGAREALIL